MKHVNAAGRRGFTLIEMIAVLTIVVILTAIAVPAAANLIEDSKKSADASAAGAIGSALKTTAAELNTGNYNTDVFTFDPEYGMYDPAPTVGQALENAGLAGSREAAEDLLSPRQRAEGGGEAYFWFHTGRQAIQVFGTPPDSDWVKLTYSTKLGYDGLGIVNPYLAY